MSEIDRRSELIAWAVNATASDVADRIDELESMLRWIPVEERLPEMPGKFMVMATLPETTREDERPYINCLYWDCEPLPEWVEYWKPLPIPDSITEGV